MDGSGSLGWFLDRRATRVAIKALDDLRSRIEDIKSFDDLRAQIEDVFLTEVEPDTDHLPEPRRSRGAAKADSPEVAASSRSSAPEMAPEMAPNQAPASGPAAPDY